ncbi:glycosyltransferase [Sphingomonas sp.]|uniref:glycosyltransferase n=1 Tax=Sphingomonas sp. TaxID=28214 RepID=UPI0025D570D0|nr:glycosyltransferase [Sphingomonas sp.]
MRILIFLHSFEPGGVERVAIRLCKAWVADGAHVTLILGRGDGAMRGEAGSLLFQTLSTGRFPTAAWETLWMILRLPGVIRRERPNVLFCAGNSYSIVSVVMKLFLRRDCPPIVAKISNDLARADFPPVVRALYRRWLRIQARHIDRFVGMAPPTRDEIAGAMNIDPASVAIIDDPALSMADIARFGVPRDQRVARTRFVAAGRLAPQKNFPLLLLAFAKIARDGDLLTILGDGPERGKLAELSQSLGIAGQVRLVGHVTDIAPEFAEAEIFALSSDYEGVPAVIAEAMAAGLAIVTTDASVSMADMLGGHGEIVPTGDLDALAAALDRSRTVPVDGAAMRRQAERFTIERAASRYLDVFAGTISQSAPLTPDQKDG